MTEFVNRAEIERKLARVLSKDLRGELDKLMGYLGDPPDLSRVPAEYWNNGWRGIQKDVEPILVAAFIQQAEDFEEQQQADPAQCQAGAVDQGAGEDAGGGEGFEDGVAGDDGHQAEEQPEDGACAAMEFVVGDDLFLDQFYMQLFSEF